MPAHPARSPCPARPSRPAFTLIELLIVVGIISILLAAAVVVGVRVTSSGKQRVTEGIIKALDTSLSSYVSSQERIPPPYVVDPDPANPTNPGQTKYIQPVADARNGQPGPDGTNQMINSVGLYLTQLYETEGGSSMLSGIDPKYLRKHHPDFVSGARNWALQPELLTVFDGWGQPIRYVHPAFKGIFPQGSNPLLYLPVSQLAGDAPPGTQYGITSIRRTGKVPVGSPSPDADAGFPATNRPYFYSIGPDGKAGYEHDSNYVAVNDFNADNVWAGTAPRYEK
ncbi:MAG: type II secretion system protein [Phycisphaerales bacterium]